MQAKTRTNPILCERRSSMMDRTLPPAVAGRLRYLPRARLSGPVSVKRHLPALSSTTFDLLVIGGGITGCCIARDAARRGLSVALIERNDFSGGTSAATSKLIHGGLRYLRELQVNVVRESLRERRTWQHIAPHVVAPMTFLLPATSRANHLVMRLGLMTYDALAWDRDRALPAEQHIPRHVTLTGQEAGTKEPVLAGRVRAGAFAYGDAHSLAPERLAIECLLDATTHGAIVANYAEAIGLQQGTPHVVTVRDGLGQTEFTITAKVVLNAGGPWADNVARALGASHPPVLTRSKGIHIITRSLTQSHALLVPVRDRHFFVIPWRSFSLIGTTDTPYNDPPDDVGVTEQDITDFLDVINEGLPAAQLQRGDVRMAYAGLRPLVGTGPSTYKASRKSGVFSHGPRLLSAIGGKWTTSRALAEECVDDVVKRLGISARPCDTAQTPLPGAGHAHVPSADEHLLRPLGTLTRQMDPALPLTARLARYAATSEMAMTLSDVLFRRTGLGTLGPPSDGDLATVAAALGSFHGWTPERTHSEHAAVAAYYRRVSMLS